MHFVFWRRSSDVPVPCLTAHWPRIRGDVVGCYLRNRTELAGALASTLMLPSLHCLLRGGQRYSPAQPWGGKPKGVPQEPCATASPPAPSDLSLSALCHWSPLRGRLWGSRTLRILGEGTRGGMKHGHSSAENQEMNGKGTVPVGLWLANDESPGWAILHHKGHFVLLTVAVM